MTSTYTTRGRANLQGTGDNTDAWGPELNNGAIQRLDDMWGVNEITVNGNVTLTVENAIEDQSRGFVIRMSGAGGFTVTHPDVDKPYLLANDCAAAVTFQPNGGTGVSVPAGWRGIYYTNAAGDTGYLVNLRLDQIAVPTASVSLNSQKITNLATPTASTDAATKGYIDTIASSGNLATVAGIAPQIVTVAGVASDIPAVAAVASDIPLLAAIDGDIAQLADMFVGARTTDPTVRLDGSALQAGDYYLNTASTPVVRVYSGSAWIPVASLSLSSQPQAEAGSDNTTAMTPLRVSQAITALAGDVVLETFTASGTFTKQADDIAYIVECIGAGGSGAKGGSTNTSVIGGFPGNVTSRFLIASEVSSTETVTVGSGGAATSSAANTAASGNSGGASSFGSLARADGGLGGASNSGSIDFLYTRTMQASSSSVTLSIYSGSETISASTGTTTLGSITVNMPTGGGAVASGTARAAALSRGYGAGGAASGTAGVNGSNGAAPGGGGGAYLQTTTQGQSGAGARGEVRVYRFKRRKA